MTLFDFAHVHPILAVFFALLGAGTVVTVVAMFVTWRIARPVKYSAADRAALTDGAARLRHAWHINSGAFSGNDVAAERLERMAAR